MSCLFLFASVFLGDDALTKFYESVGRRILPYWVGPWCILEPCLSCDLSKPIFLGAMVSDTEPATTSHDGSTSQVNTSHTGKTSPTYGSHVGDQLLASTSHVGSMSLDTAKEVT